MHASTHQLEEELARLSEQLEAARDLQRAAEERHAREDAPETGTAREGRREEADSLQQRRSRVVGELRRRAVEEKGWSQDHAGEGAAPPGAGRAGRLRIGPHPLLPERGFVIHDRQRTTVAWVRRVPTPARAEELLEEHGVPWEEELVSHSLSPVPEEEERP